MKRELIDSYLWVARVTYGDFQGYLQRPIDPLFDFSSHRERRSESRSRRRSYLVENISAFRTRTRLRTRTGTPTLVPTPAAGADVVAIEPLAFSCYLSLIAWS